MEKERSTLIQLLSLMAVVGNILFMLWVSYNGLKEHFSGTIYEKISYIGLMGLLILNTVLILRDKKK